MSEEQIVERVARLIDPGAWEDPYLGPHGEDFRAGDQAEAIETAQNIIQGLGLREEHGIHPRCPEDTWMGGPYRCCGAQLMTNHCEHERAETRLLTDWQEDAHE